MRVPPPQRRVVDGHTALLALVRGGWDNGDLANTPVFVLLPDLDILGVGLEQE